MISPGDLQNHLAAVVKGGEAAAFELIAAVLAGGHVLIEGPPGVGKTTLGKTFASAIGGTFRRVQFTPDLLPSDLLGYSLLRRDSGEFQFVEGPVFCNILLADEINRTSPRIQSALLECMGEKQVTVDGETYPLPATFHVVATRNNLYSTGTFPLPEPQLDRFLISMEMGLPQAQVQVDMLKFHLQPGAGHEAFAGLEPGDIEGWKKAVGKLHVSEAICDYVIRLCEALRNHKQIEVELSNRASLALLHLSRAVAFMEGRPGVHPEDVKRALRPVMVHRIIPAEKSGPGANGGTLRRNALALLDEIEAEVAVD